MFSNSLIIFKVTKKEGIEESTYRGLDIMYQERKYTRRIKYRIISQKQSALPIWI